MLKEPKRLLRVISYMLCVALMVSSAPMQVFAEEINDVSKELAGATASLVPGSSSIPLEEPVVEKTTIPEAQIITEVVDRREENVKHFKMSDGTYIAAEYEEPVHYRQNDKWEDIDNTLIEKKAIDSNDFSGYENDKNSFKIKLSKSYNEKQLVSIKQGKYSLSWRFLSQEKLSLFNFFGLWKNVSIKNTSENKEIGNQSFLKKTKLSSSIKYGNAITGVDLEYVLDSTSVKENIIVKQKLSSYDFAFGYKAQGLKAVLNDDGSISFVDEKTSEIVFETPAPYMYDSAGQESLDVKYFLEETSEGCNITISADPNWMNAPERAYPITIDPQIHTKTGPKNTIEGFTATSGAVSPRSFTTGHMYVGNESTYGRCRIYIKNDLPTLTQQDMVIGATMTMIQTASGYSGSGSMILNAYEIKSSWNSATITDSNAPTLGPILDYNIISSANNSSLPSSVGYVYFDITKAVKGWYEGTSTNHGIAIRSNNESELKRSRYYTSDHPDITNAGPCIIIQYVNNMGLEDYWSYHTQSVGRAGIGAVNDYTGNLVFEHVDLALNGSRLPGYLSHVYNSKKSNASFFPLANGYQGLNTGRGWQLNVTQRIDITTGTLASTYPYYYTDEDGTVHYFMLKSGVANVWVDEDGLGYELTRPTVDGSAIYHIKDKSGNVLKFTPWGYLQYVQDNNGNTMSLAYTGAILSTVTDGAGRVTTFVANEYGYLIKIIDPSNRETLFGYSGQLLTTITYPDGTQSLYGYDANGNLSSVTSPDGYKVNYTHASSPKSGPRVAQIDERGKNNEYGGSMRITYSANKSSTFEDPGDDYSYTTSTDNYFVTYNFDNAGRVINVSDQYGNAEMYSYSNANNSSRNKITSSAVSNESVFNLTRDSSGENYANWNAGVWQTGSGNTYSSARSTENPYIGTTSFKITNAPTGSNSCYPYYSQQIPITKKNTYYTFSAYVKTSLTTNRSAGAILSAYLLESGAATYYSSTTTSTDWERLTITFFVPATSTATAVTVMFGIKDETGSAWFDCVQLEEGNTANRYNLLENSSFENVTSSLPTAWTGTNLTASDVAVTSGKIGANAMKIVGSQTINKGLSQTVVTGGTESDCYVISGWAKADSVPLTGGRYYALDVGIRYTDNTTVWKVFNFNADNTNWQYLSAVFDCSDNNSSTNKTVSAIYVYILYYSNANTAYFDGLQLNKDEANSYSYDANGNLVSTVDIARTSSTFDYSGENELVKNMNPEGGSYNYAYDTTNKHRLLFATSEVGSRYGFDYDSYGNVTKAGIQNDAHSTAIVSGRTYLIRAKHSGKYMEVQNSSDTNGATVIQNAYTGSANQQWLVTDIGGGYYRFTPQNSTTRSLDVNNGNTADNTKM